MISCIREVGLGQINRYVVISNRNGSSVTGKDINTSGELRHTACLIFGLFLGVVRPKGV